MSSPPGSHHHHDHKGHPPDHNIEIVWAKSVGDTINAAYTDTVVGAADTVTGFSTPADPLVKAATDTVLGSATYDAGKTVIHLADGSSISFVGVDSWPSALFKTH